MEQNVSGKIAVRLMEFSWEIAFDVIVKYYYLSFRKKNTPKIRQFAFY